jgi:phosphate transport system protein
MVTARRQFHEELETLELDILSMGELAEQALRKAMEALDSGDPDTADQVIAGDDEIDDRYLSVERRWLELLALQTPVASDLRLVSVILHVNLHLERIGDMAVNIAKIAKLTSRLPANQTILSHLKEMADVVRPMLRTSLDAFVRRDIQLASSEVDRSGSRAFVSRIRGSCLLTATGRVGFHMSNGSNRGAL